MVLARDLVGSVPAGSDLRRVLAELALGYPDCWTFSVDGMLGSSPETLVRSEAGTVSARVLAGTAPRGRDAVTDEKVAAGLTRSPKDLAEHGYAVQSVLATLGPHTTRLQNSQPFTLQLPNLWHLATDVEGVLHDGSTSLDLVAAMHPTAAVAGTPTEAALAIIRELEPFDRGRYAGPVGWIDANGDGEWAIALRCAQVGRRRLHPGICRLRHSRRQRAGRGARRVAHQVPADRGGLRVGAPHRWSQRTDSAQLAASRAFSCSMS